MTGRNEKSWADQGVVVTGACGFIGSHLVERVRPAASEVRRLCADNTLLKKLTGWTPPARLEEGLRLTIEWMRNELHRYDPKKYYL